MAGPDGSVFERVQEDDGEEAADAPRAVGDGALEVIRGERIDALALAAGDS